MANDNDEAGGWLFLGIVGLALSPIIIGLALCWLTCEILAFLMTGPLKGHLWRRFDIESIAIWWVNKWDWLHFIVKWGAATVLSAILIALVNEIYFAKSLNPFWLTLAIIGAAPVAGLCAFVYGFMCWLAKIMSDPEVRQRAAGKEAEEQIQGVIELYIKRQVGGRTLHGPLLVFHAGTPNEYSAELDHVLVTPRNLYLIETKYKSGTIHARETDAEWLVENSQGTTYMRSALLQVKNSANVIRRELNLSIPIVPLVAFVGRDVAVVDGPSNVMAGEHLPNVVAAFEQNSAANTLYQPDEIISKLQSFRVVGRAARLKHDERAKAKRERLAEDRRKAEAARIVRSASLD
jgi:hypothetical protein